MELLDSFLVSQFPALGYTLLLRTHFNGLVTTFQLLSVRYELDMSRGSLDYT